MSKDELLARVRAAVALGARGAGPAAGDPPHVPGYTPTHPDPAAAVPSEELVGLFCAELENSGVGFSRAGSADEITDLLEGLLPSGAGVSVALSDAVSELLPGFVERLLGRGVRVVTPPRARAAGGGERPAAGGDGGDGREEEYRRALFECEAGVTTADYGVAETGTLALVSGGERHRLISLLPPVHVCLLGTDRLLPVMGRLLERARVGGPGGPALPHALTLISGPSRTADIEQTLTTGVHGPHRLHVLLHPPRA
jgi:L-lactate dehydrogenase complex protein LldG